MATFRKVQLTVTRGNGYGQYVVSARYYGKDIRVHTTDSEIFDWLDDESNQELHTYAKQAAYKLIRNAYEQVSN